SAVPLGVQRRASTIEACRGRAGGAGHRRLAVRMPGEAYARRSPRCLTSPVLKPFLHDPSQVAVREFQDCATANVERELFELRVTGPGELVDECARRETKVAAQTCGETFQESRRLSTARAIKLH